MHPHSLCNRQAPCAPMKWAECLLVGLFALLLSGLVPAYAEEPHAGAGAGDFEHSLVVAAVSTTVDIEAWREEGPHCRHGHGQFVLSKGVPRGDRPDIELDDTLTVATAPATPPILVAASGTPRQRPAKSGVPVYLLTERVRL